ncbi:hypothetical protein VZT92_009138 [Zoarces viviparus]|uniref:Secreted protein n=1 Tax=Zoarces viviparus TaxID=48416 RepID=A0AAW1FHF4_ZOAVI
MLRCRWMVEMVGMVGGYVLRAVPKGQGDSRQKGEFSTWLHSGGGLLVTSEHTGSRRQTRASFFPHQRQVSGFGRCRPGTPRALI